MAIVATMLVAACAPQATDRGTDASQTGQAAAKKRISVATNGNLFTVSGLLSVGNTGTATPGTAEVGRLVNAGLTIPGRTQPLEPQLAEAVPTVENGLWKVLPDGRMETTWKIRAAARWQDGAPVTADDVLFIAAIGQDPDLAFVRDPKLRLIDSIEAPDQQTVLVRWKELHIEADQLFGTPGTLPVPKHILEEPYTTNKANFLELPFWSAQFVGSGPYRINRWEDGVGAILAASDTYALGRPRIDEIEVKFIPSSPTLVANILAGSVDMTLGRGLSEQQAAQLRDNWRDGVVSGFGSPPNVINAQYQTPSPAIVANVQFRRALLQALDRNELASALTDGMGVIAHTGLPLDEPVYREIEKAAVKYDYDPRQAIQMIERLGYTRTADGVFQDASGQKLGLELRSSDKDLNVRTALAVANYWKLVGVPTENVVVPAARQADVEYRALYPSFDYGGTTGSLGSLRDLRRAEVPTPENSYRGRNRGGYVNGELENLVDRYYVTIPMAERLNTLGSIYRILTDQVVPMFLYYNVTVVMVSNRLRNVSPDYFGNAHEWDMTT